MNQLASGAYRIPLFIFLWVDARRNCTIGRHGLIFILSKVEDVLSLVVMDALDDLGSDERAFRNNAL